MEKRQLVEIVTGTKTVFLIYRCQDSVQVQTSENDVFAEQVLG